MLLVDGNETEILIYKYLTLPEKYDVVQEMAKALKGQKIGNLTKDEVELTPEMMTIIPILAKKVWADKNYKIDDVEGDSLNVVLAERLEKFLGSFGFRGEVSSSPSGGPGADGRPRTPAGEQPLQHAPDGNSNPVE